MDLPLYQSQSGPNAARQLARERERTVGLMSEAEQRLNALAVTFSEALDAHENAKAARARIRDLARHALSGGAR
jgi:hypothetical protein